MKQTFSPLHPQAVNKRHGDNVKCAPPDWLRNSLLQSSHHRLKASLPQCTRFFLPHTTRFTSTQIFLAWTRFSLNRKDASMPVGKLLLSAPLWLRWILSSLSPNARSFLTKIPTLSLVLRSRIRVRVLLDPHVPDALISIVSFGAWRQNRYANAEKIWDGVVTYKQT